MKITIRLSNAPLSITIETTDEITKDMIDLVAKTLLKMREVWLNALELANEVKVAEDGGS